MVHPQLQEILLRLKRRMAELYGGRLVSLVLFGSQARRDAQPDSDIDVLVVLDDEVNPCDEVLRTSGFVAELCLEYSAVISCIFVSRQEYEQKQNAYFYRNVHRDGVLI